MTQNDIASTAPMDVEEPAVTAVPLPAIETPDEDLEEEDVPLSLPEGFDDEGNSLGLDEDDIAGDDENLDPLFSPDPAPGLQPSRSQLVGASGLYNVAMMNTIMTPEDVEAMLRENAPRPSRVGELIASMKAEDAEVSEMAIKATISDASVGPQEKLGAIRMLHGDRTPDVNGVQRLVASNAATADYYIEDAEDDAEWLDVSLDRASDIPKEVEAYDPGAATLEASRAATWAALDQMYKDAGENASTLDYVEMMTPIGSLPTLNATVSRIYEALGLEGRLEKGLSYGAVGTALMDLRQTFNAADPGTRAEMAKVVLRELKNNTGLFQDSNDLVTMQVLENLFSEEVGVGDRFAAEDIETSKEKAALDARQKAIAKQLQKGGLTLAQRRELQQERGEILSDINNMSGYTIADNIFNTLDLVGVGQIGRTTLRLGTKWMPRAWDSIFKASPAQASRRLADAIENPDIAAQMGLRPEDAANAALPNGGVLSRGANALAELSRRQAAARAQLMRQAAPVNLTADERLAALGEIADDVDALVSKKLAKPHVNFSTVTMTPDGNGADIVAVFGKTHDRGYATLHGARSANRAMVEEVFGHQANDSIVYWDNALQKMVDVPPNAKHVKGREYFIQAQDTRSLASAKQTWGTLNLGDDTVADLSFGAGVSRWLNGTTIFNNITLDWISTRSRAAASAKALGLGLIKPIVDLPFESKQMLAKIVKDNEGKVLTTNDLRALGASDDVVDGYHAFRTMDDLAYEGADRQIRIIKQRQGMKDVIVNGVRAGFAKPYERLAAAGLADELVFNPVTGVSTKMSKADIQNLYANNGSLGRMDYPINGKNGTARLMLLSEPGTRVLPLPQSGVLPRIPGHYPHISQGNFVVYGTKNGVRTAIKLAATQSDAAAYVASRQAIMASRGAKGKGTMFDHVDYELDASLQMPEAFAAKLDEVMVNRGGLVYGKRDGSFLGNLSKDFGAVELDPIASLLQGFEVVSQTVTKGELVATMKQRLHNFLRLPENKNLFIGADTPAERLSIANINSGFSGIKARDTALAYMKQIEVIERTPDAIRQAARAVYNRMAYTAFKIGENRWVKAAGGKAVTRRIEQAASTAARQGANPVNAFMSTLHAMYIAIPAARQFVLNVAQTSMASSLHPLQAAKSWRQLAGLSGAVYSRIQFLHGGARVFDDAMLDQYAKQTSKMTGLGVEELKQLVNTIVDSGLIDAVSHNTMIKEAIGDATSIALTKRASATSGALGAVGRGLGSVGRAVKAPVNFMSKIGFQAGENINQIVSFLHLYNADKAKGIANLVDQAYVDTLIGRTAELTGNMISEAAPQYTRSFFKPFMQWMQFQHKMVLLGLPKSIGGSARFTGVEKARMAATQFLLFGSKATATTAIVHEIVERGIVERLEAEDPENAGKFVELWRSNEGLQFMEGFIFDYTANKVFQALFGEADEEFNEFSWSKTFAPGSGFDSLSERIIGIFTLDLEGAMGAQGKFYSGLKAYANQVMDVSMARWRKMDDVPFDVRAEQLMKQGGALMIAPYNKYLANAWARENDRRINASGKVSEGFTSDIEMVLNTAFGIETKDRDSYFAARDRLEESFKGKEGDHVKEIADTYWKQLVNNSTVFAAEATSDDLYDEMLKNYTNDQALLLSALGPRDKEALNAIIGEKLQNAAFGEGDEAEKAFIKRITEKLARHGFGESGPRIGQYLRHLEFVKDNPAFKQAVIDAIEEITEEPAAQNITQNEVAK